MTTQLHCWPLQAAQAIVVSELLLKAGESRILDKSGVVEIEGEAGEGRECEEAVDGGGREAAGP